MSQKFEERQLLETRAKLARLKIIVEQLKLQQPRKKISINGIMGLAAGLSSYRFLWNILRLPVGWRYRMIAVSGSLLWKLWRNKR